jgi:outer membrane protein
MIALLVVLIAQATPSHVLTLQEAQRVGLERQPQLQVAQGFTQAAQGRVEQFRSPLLPQVTVTADYDRFTTNRLYRFGGIPFSAQPTSWSSVNYYDSSITLTQQLWDFGQNSNKWQSSQASARAAADQERTTSQQTVLQVRTAFFNAVASKELLAVARETLANQHNHLVQIDEFVKAGTRPPIDLSQARADYANAEVQVVNVENAYLRSKLVLNQAMGVEGPIDYDVANEALPPQHGEDGALEPLLQIALEARPEIASAMEQVKAQQLLIKSARGSYGPTISAVGTVVQSTVPGSGYTGWDAAAGVALTWNVFQGGLTNGTIHEAEGNLTSAVGQLNLLRQQVRVDVDQALLAIRTAKAALSSARDALVAARQRLSLAEGRYRNGQGSVIELGDAQIAEANAAAQVVQTEFQLSTARAQLLFALGR